MEGTATRKTEYEKEEMIPLYSLGCRSRAVVFQRIHIEKCAKIILRRLKSQTAQEPFLGGIYEIQRMALGLA